MSRRAAKTSTHLHRHVTPSCDPKESRRSFLSLFLARWATSTRFRRWRGIRIANRRPRRIRERKTASLARSRRQLASNRLPLPPLLPRHPQLLLLLLLRFFSTSQEGKPKNPPPRGQPIVLYNVYLLDRVERSRPKRARTSARSSSPPRAAAKLPTPSPHVPRAPPRAPTAAT